MPQLKYTDDANLVLQYAMAGMERKDWMKRMFKMKQEVLNRKDKVVRTADVKKHFNTEDK